MRSIGFWEEELRILPREHEDNQPMRDEVINLIVPNWNETDEAKAVIEYMKSGKKLIHYKGWANHRLTGEKLGCEDWASPDGKWKYPEKWWRYIETHSVRPNNEEFIQDAVKWWNGRLKLAEMMKNPLSIKLSPEIMGIFKNNGNR